MNRLFDLALFSIAVVPCVPASAEEKHGGDRLTIKSHVLGEDRVALVRTPAGYATNDQRYPVLYMTDGAAQLAHTASTIEFLARNGRIVNEVLQEVRRIRLERGLDV